MLYVIINLDILIFSFVFYYIIRKGKIGKEKVSKWDN